MITEAIVLAGGLGTRLRSTVPDLPKCMAPVAGEPFLAHVIRYYRNQGVDRFVFSLGYKHEIIESFLKKQFSDLHYDCSVEDEPLGTGGAVFASASKTNDENVLVLNGDTLFAVDLNQVSSYHLVQASDCTLTLKTMINSDRYGVVETDEHGRITSFREKKFYPQANINGGVYALNIRRFISLSFPRVFSFEKDFLETQYEHMNMRAIVQNGYFIDIGIPEDYLRAQSELKVH
jgi:D-glycero-alpha-D-manno-heptose 1-phosphate guanylyltransferase